MDVVAARGVLGVGPGTSDDDLRRAYRAALRRSHPDHGGRGDRVQDVVDAYRTLLAAPPGPDPATSPRPGTAWASAPDGPTSPTTEPATAWPSEDRAAAMPTAGDAVTVEGDTVAAELPAGDLFAMLVEVGHRIGAVAYVDELAGILEVVVTFADHGACSVVLTLQGRATGTTEAFCTVEALGPGQAPPPEAVAELLADGLRTLVEP
jgi:hypothetical protein